MTREQTLDVMVYDFNKYIKGLNESNAWKDAHCIKPGSQRIIDLKGDRGAFVEIKFNWGSGKEYSACYDGEKSWFFVMAAFSSNILNFLSTESRAVAEGWNTDLYNGGDVE